MVNEELLKLLVCPVGLSPLRLEEKTLICQECGTKYAIVDDIPNMLIEEAELPVGCATVKDLPCVRSGKAKGRIDPD